eukprot:246231_1
MIRELATDILVRRVSPAAALGKREVHSKRFIKGVLQAPASRREREARYKAASQRNNTLIRKDQLGNEQESIPSSHQQPISLPLRYTATYVPPYVLPNGWAPPPPPEERYVLILSKLLLYCGVCF